ncbi:12655_t:CDS:2 [Funneliformis caledonium]|uniref:12655_t:CDS:1 n=1 Tax=Funneliformis caledonium TaxID=1117310 RepID=A0A9N8YSB9_9GLOM|nr:12655_t:CDS:2 [Funneliformis caledonium]
MKVQIILLFFIAYLASESYAKQCKISCKGKNVHEIGGSGSGCYGLDPSDPFRSCEASTPGTSYEFFDDFGCKGSVVRSGQDFVVFRPPPVKAKSVKISCP